MYPIHCSANPLQVYIYLHCISEGFKNKTKSKAKQINKQKKSPHKKPNPNTKAHVTSDPAYRKDDDIELRKQPLTAVTGFGLLGRRSHVKANTYSTLLQAAFLIF